MSLFDRLFEGFQFMAQLGPKVQALNEELGGLDRDLREIQMRVVRLETLVELMRAEKLPALPMLIRPAEPDGSP